MFAIFFFCILPIVLLGVATIGATIIQIGMNGIEEDFSDDFDDD